MHASESEIVAVHVCKHCGHGVRREQMSSAELVSGVLECKLCGQAGPLNLEIRSELDRKPPGSARVEE